MKLFAAIGAVLAAFFAFGAAAQTVYSIAANPQGSLLYSTAAAISKVAQERVGLQFRVAPYGGSSTYLPLLNKGEIEFGLANGGEYYFAFHGTEIFKGQPNPNIRLISRLYSIDGNFAVPVDSPIKTIKDLKGKRVSSDYTAGIVFHYLTAALLATEGLTYEDVRKLPVPTFIAGINNLTQGKADAAYIPLNSAVGREAMASIRGGWRYITFEVTPKTGEIMGGFFPFSTPNVLQPSADAIGVASPSAMIQVWTYLAANKDVPDDVVYKVTKTLYEQQSELAASFPNFRQMTQSNMVDAHTNPWHPGAIKFFTENNRWKR